MNNKQRGVKARGLPQFAGIALADILANGAAILILLIIIHLSVKTELDQNLSEQTEAVSSLLTREVVSSLVMNALPTSPPAVLHHYEHSLIDRRPTRRIMPILVLTDLGVMDYYTQERITGNLLFQKNNPLDSLLLSLNQFQRHNIRLDVYSIKHFYVVMSILRSHEIEIKHWHFLADPPQVLKSKTQQPLFSLKNHQAQSFQQNTLMEGVDIKPYNGDEITSQKYGGVIGQGYQQQSIKVNQTLNIPSDNQNQTLPSEEAKIQDFRNILAFLYSFLEDIKIEINSGNLSYLDQVNLSEMIQQYILSFPALSEYRAFLVERVYAALANVNGPWPKIKLNQSTQSANITLPVNKVINVISIESDLPSVSSAIDDELSFHVYRYPSFGKSKEQYIDKQTAIVLNPADNDYRHWGWHSVGVLNFHRGQSLVGFIYGYLNEHDQLVLKADENQVLLNGKALPSHVVRNENRSQKNALKFYLLLAFLLVLLLLGLNYRYAH